jgi:hypothetical protein
VEKVKYRREEVLHRIECENEEFELILILADDELRKGLDKYKMDRIAIFDWDSLGLRPAR